MKVSMTVVRYGRKPDFTREVTRQEWKTITGTPEECMHVLNSMRKVNDLNKWGSWKIAGIFTPEEETK